MTQGQSTGSTVQEAAGQPSATQNGAVPQELEFLDLLIIVAQRKKLVWLITGVGTFIALAIALLLPPEYTATVVLLPPRPYVFVDSTAADKSEDKSSTSGKESGKAQAPLDLNEMYVSILKSRPVEEAVIQRYGLMAEYHQSYLADARKTLESHAKIDGSTKDGLIRLNLSDRNPGRAAEIANGYIEQFRTVSEHLVIPEATGQNTLLQVVESAVPPEKKSFPNRTLITLAGTGVGLTLGIMLALLEGGLVRLQGDPATRSKLELLKSLVSIRHNTNWAESADVRLLRPRPETTGM